MAIAITAKTGASSTRAAAEIVRSIARLRIRELRLNSYPRGPSRVIPSMRSTSNEERPVRETDGSRLIRSPSRLISPITGSRSSWLRSPSGPASTTRWICLEQEPANRGELSRVVETLVDVVQLHELDRDPGVRFELRHQLVGDRLPADHDAALGRSYAPPRHPREGASGHDADEHGRPEDEGSGGGQSPPVHEPYGEHRQDRQVKEGGDLLEGGLLDQVLVAVVETERLRDDDHGRKREQQQRVEHPPVDHDHAEHRAADALDRSRGED